MNSTDEEEGKISYLTGDASETIVVAIFNSINDTKAIKEDFISNYEVSKQTFLKFGTNMRYFFKSKLKSLPDSCFHSGLVMLGKRFRYGSQSYFKEAFEDIIWVTYRENFRTVDSTRLLNSDVGWGCTIRVGQMMLLSVLKRHLGMNNLELIPKIQENCLSAPYSLHKVIDIGKTIGKKPGDWYSPSGIGYVITKLLEESSVKGLKCYMSMNCAIYRDAIYALAWDIHPDDICKCEIDENYVDLGQTCSRCNKSINVEPKWINSVFIQLPLMLGMKLLLPEYIDTLKCILEMEEVVGIVGGKPRMAMFIVGYTGDQVIVLDPHNVQSAARSEEELKRLLGSYKCSTPMVVGFDEVESSFNIGFYIKDESSWLRFAKQISNNSRIKGTVSIYDHEDSGSMDLIHFDLD